MQFFFWGGGGGGGVGGGETKCIISNVEMANIVCSRLSAPSVKFKPGRVVDEAFCSLFESGFY